MLAEYRRELELQLQAREVKQEIERLRATYAVFGEHSTIEELAALVRPGNRDFDAKDAVLRILLAEIKRRPLLFLLLSLMFWDSLAAIYNRSRLSMANPDELFARIQTDSFQIAMAYPLDRRPQKIDVNLVLDTRKKVTTWLRAENRLQQRYEPIDRAAAQVKRLAEVQDSNVLPEEMESYLLDLVRRGVIDRCQFDLLIETEVYRRMSQKEWAETRHVPHSTARTWRFRAEQAVREYEKTRREQEDRE